MSDIEHGGVSFQYPESSSSLWLTSVCFCFCKLFVLTCLLFPQVESLSVFFFFFLCCNCHFLLVWQHGCPEENFNHTSPLWCDLNHRPQVFWVFHLVAGLDCVQRLKLKQSWFTTPSMGNVHPDPLKSKWLLCAYWSKLQKWKLVCAQTVCGISSARVHTGAESLYALIFVFWRFVKCLKV